MIHAVKALRHDRARAEPALPEPLHHYFEEKILVTQWYPDTDFMAIVRALAAVFPAPKEGHWQWIGRQGAAANFTGIYAAMVRPGDPAETLRRYPRMWRIHHNAGDVKVTMLDATRARVEIRHPLAEHQEFCRLQIGHIGELVKLAGAEKVEVELLHTGSRREPGAWIVQRLR